MWNKCKWEPMKPTEWLFSVANLPRVNKDEEGMLTHMMLKLKCLLAVSACMGHPALWMKNCLYWFRLTINKMENINRYRSNASAGLAPLRGTYISLLCRLQRVLMETEEYCRRCYIGYLRCNCICIWGKLHKVGICMYYSRIATRLTNLVP